MKIKSILLSLIFLVAATGCGKKTAKFSETESQKVFGVTQQDVALELNQKVIGLKPSGLVQDQVLVNTVEIVKLAELFLNSKSLDLKEKANILFGLISVPDQTSTYMTSSVVPAGSPYVEQAYLFLKPFLISQYSHILQKSQARVEISADKLVRPQESNMSSKSYLEFIIIQLKDFNKNLLSMSEADTSNFINPVTKKIEEEYIKPLSSFMPYLNWNRDRKLTVYLNQLQEAIKFIPGLTDAEKKMSIIQLSEAFDYSKQNDESKDSTGSFALIVDMWLNKAQRQKSPKILIETFKKLTDKQLLALASNNMATLHVNAWEKLKSRKDYEKMTDKELISIATENTNLLKNEDWLQLQNNFNKSFLNHADLADIYLARSVGLESSDQDKFISIVAFWLNLKVRYSFPEILVKKFNEFSDKELEDLKDTSWWNFSLVRRGVIDYIENFPGSDGKKPSNAEDGTANFRIYMSNKVYASVESTLRSKIQGLAMNLKFMVRDEVISQLEAKKAVFPQIVFEDFNKYASRYLKEWFFKQRNRIPLFEAQKIEFKKVAQSWVATGAALGETSSNLIGASLSFASVQLNSDYSTEEKNKIAYQVVNKLSAISGYQDYNMNPVDALMSPVIGGAKKKFNLRDIQNYNPLETTFAIPDKVFLAGQYKGHAEKNLYEPNVSLEGQMRLLSAYAKLMNWFKNWKPTTFDNTLSPLRLNEFPQQEIFPKKELFKQSLSLSLSILKNLSARMAGPFDKNAGKAAGAIVYGFNGRGESQSIVRTYDVALTMEAVVDFCNSVEDIGEFNDPEIKSALAEIQSAVTQLKTLLTGLTLFVSTKLTLPDSGFAYGYNLHTQKVLNNKRTLIDQLQMQRALIKTGKFLNSDLLKLKAIDNYYFINKNLWNDAIGFYSETEGGAQPLIKLSLLLESVESLKLIAVTLSDFSSTDASAKRSLTQLVSMLQYWNSRHLAGLNKNQSVVDLLGYQSPAFSQ